MASTVKYPIRLKLVLLLGTAVLSATLAYLALAVTLFKEDKTSLVYELNSSAVRTLSAQVEALIGKSADKVRLLTQGHADAAWVRSVLESEPDLIAYELYRTKDGSNWERTASLRNTGYLKLYGLDASSVEKIRETVPLPLAEAFASKSLAFNSTVPGGAPILTLAIAMEVEGTPHVAVVDLRLDRILKLVGDRGIATVYVVDRLGGIVAHPDSGLVSSRASAAEVPIVKEALGSQVAFQLRPFDWKEGRWIGAFSAVGIGRLNVISQVEERQAFRAAGRLAEKSALFGMLVVTASVLAAIWVARSLTDPLRRLVEATERFSRWDFDGTVHVKTHDEIAWLARAFNTMAGDLRNQRAQLDRHREELELKVKERTQALESQKKQASAAQEALLRTTRLASLGELAGSAAHEVLNPVNNINIRIERIKSRLAAQGEDAEVLREIVEGWKRAYSSGGWSALEQELRKPSGDARRSLLEEDLENLEGLSRDLRGAVQERGEDAEFITKEIFRVSRIVNGMRALSRVGGDRRAIDVHQPLEDTFAALSDLFEGKRVALVRDFSSDPRSRFTVTAAKDELVQVFTNLIRNALQAVESAGRRAGEVRVSTRRTEGRVEIRIEDNGTGISKDHLGRIFEADFTTKSLEDGTGLGLSISRRLVRAFTGDIEVERTREGDGTVFLVWLPATEGANDS